MLTFSSPTQLPWCVLCSDTLVCSKMLLSLILCSHLLHVQFDVRKFRHFSESVHINFIMLLNILVAYQPLGEICTLKNYSCKYIFVKICLVYSIWRQLSVSVNRVCTLLILLSERRHETGLTPDVKKSPFSLCIVLDCSISAKACVLCILLVVIREKTGQGSLFLHQKSPLLLLLLCTE